ncbi:DUF2269 domain-containing protein [bacterium CPR1]|nr:DUF2269 domain-containing protein [bacterium CPR1]
MSYLWLKWLHILSATLMLGTGLGSAYYKYFTVRSGNVQAMAVVLRLVVLADILFTIPSVILQPLTGLAMAGMAHQPLTRLWILGSIIGYFVAGACWLPAFWLQLKMKDMAQIAATRGAPLPPRFHRYGRIWALLGIPAFGAMLVVYYFMVFKPG